MRFQVMSMPSVHRPHFEQQVTRYWVTAVLCMLRKVRSTKWIVTSFTEINDRILFWQLIRKIYQRFQITFQCFCRWDFHLDWPRVSQALCNFSHNILGGGPRDSTHVFLMESPARPFLASNSLRTNVNGFFVQQHTILASFSNAHLFYSL